MSRRKLEDREIRKLQSSKRSYFIRLPIELIRQFGWKDGQKLVAKKFGKDNIVIKDWKPGTKDK